jgi:hypothetical protein
LPFFFYVVKVKEFNGKMKFAEEFKKKGFIAMF